MDAATFRAWAKLMHRRSRAMANDAMIAATRAIRRDCDVIDPFYLVRL